MLKARARVVEDEHKGRAAPPLDLKVRDPPADVPLALPRYPARSYIWILLLQM